MQNKKDAEQVCICLFHWYARVESNHRTRLRRPLLYPLSYRCIFYIIQHFFKTCKGFLQIFYIFFCGPLFPSPAPGHWYLGFPRLAFPYSMACSGHRQMQAIQWVQSDPHTGLPSSRRILDRGQSLTQAPQPVHLSVVLNFPACTNSL